MLRAFPTHGRAMSKAGRTIQTPGGAAASAPAAEVVADDLAEYESERLPEMPAGNHGAAGLSPETATLVQRLVAEGIAKALAPKPNKRQPPAQLPTQEEARAICEAKVAQGIRPGAILTVDGHYVHPELARTADAGVARLGG